MLIDAEAIEGRLPGGGERLHVLPMGKHWVNGKSVNVTYGFHIVDEGASKTLVVYDLSKN